MIGDGGGLVFTNPDLKEKGCHCIYVIQRQRYHEHDFAKSPFVMIVTLLPRGICPHLHDGGRTLDP